MKLIFILYRSEHSQKDMIESTESSGIESINIDPYINFSRLHEKNHTLEALRWIRETPVEINQETAFRRHSSYTIVKLIGFDNLDILKNQRYIKTLYLVNCSFSSEELNRFSSVEILSIENCKLTDNILSISNDISLERMRIKETETDYIFIQQLNHLKKLSINEDDDEDWKIDWNLKY